MSPAPGADPERPRRREAGPSPAAAGRRPGRSRGRGADGRARRLAGCALACCLLLLPGGCARDRPEPAAAAIPERIIALAPSAVETLFALGLGDRVVGVGDHAAWPPEVVERPRIGGLFDPRLEEIAVLAPDLAVLLPSEEELAAGLERLGVAVLVVPFESLDDVEGAFRAIAARCGVAERGRELAAAWRRDLAADPVPGSPRVLLLVDRPPGELAGLLAAGDGTFLHELLLRLGADNVAADAPTAWPELGLEAVLGRRPEVIVELQTRSDPVVAAELPADWRAFPELPAVAAGCLEVVAGSHTLIPGPRLPLLYRQLRAVLEGCPVAAASARGAA